MLVEWSERAKRNLRARIGFLNRRNPRAARAAHATIFSASDRLAEFPNIGRPYEGSRLDFRELVIPFGNEGYTLLYRAAEDRVTIIALKHQREARY